MGHIGPDVIHSLADAASGVCGFKVHNTQDGVSLTAEWSHSLNMLDIDISSIYEEVCDGLMTDNVDVVVLCDMAKLFIGFFAHLRNRTRFTTVNGVGTFYGIKGTPLSDLVILAPVWQSMIMDRVQAILRVDTHSSSCCFQFSENQPCLFIRTRTTILTVAVVVLLLAITLLFLVDLQRN